MIEQPGALVFIEQVDRQIRLFGIQVPNIKRLGLGRGLRRMSFAERLERIGDFLLQLSVAGVQLCCRRLEARV